MPSPGPGVLTTFPLAPPALALALALHARLAFIASIAAPMPPRTPHMPREMVMDRRRSRPSPEAPLSHAATQLGPPQSTPSSFPFRTPSVQDTKAPGMSPHALPMGTYPASHVLHASPT